MKTSEILAQLILSFILISTFISIFFFTYIAKVENEIIISHIDNTVKSLTKDLEIFITPEKRKLIREVVIKNIEIPNDSETDREIDRHNKQLLDKTIIIFSIISGVGIAILAILWWVYRFDIFETLKYSIIMLLLTGVVYFLFITYITRKYILVDQNYISYVVVSALNDYANST
jgi:hypothetical protein